MKLFAFVFLLIGLNSNAHLSDIVGASGVYTPTLTNVTNIDASTAHKAQWLRVGNTVTVSGKIEIDPASAGATVLGFSLPQASNFALDNDCGGVHIGTSDDAGVVRADTVNDRASFTANHSATANQTHWYTFTYEVKQ